MSKVIVYSTATCGFCHTLKRYLSAHGIEFEEKRADSDPRLAEELMELSGQLTVPFTIIETDDGQRASVVGFDKPRLDELLGLA